MSEKDSTFLTHEATPFNGGSPLAARPLALITANEHFFVRNHAPVPLIDPADFRLVIEGLVARRLDLGLAELAAFPRQTITATLQCAGYRRDELLALGPIPGELPWGSEALATATWSGVLLADLLAAAEVLPEACYVAALGGDAIADQAKAAHFGGSIPLEWALEQPVLLADTMNGAPLPPVHGGPLRLVVPGYIGARSVKWLRRLEVRATPSENYFQQQAYRLSRDPALAPAMLGELFVNAQIAWPLPGATLPPGHVVVRGYAIGGGMVRLACVELSTDSGARWLAVDLPAERAGGVAQPWQITLDLPPGEQTLIVRARDEAGNQMPAELSETWNPKGYMNNAWHRVAITVTDQRGHQ